MTSDPLFDLVCSGAQDHYDKLDVASDADPVPGWQELDIRESVGIGLIRMVRVVIANWLIDASSGILEAATVVVSVLHLSVLGFQPEDPNRWSVTLDP